MAIKDILQNLNLYVDGRGYAGQVEELTLPKLTTVMDEYKAAGMGAPVDIPMGSHEKLEAEITLKSFDEAVLKLWQVTLNQTVPFTVRGAVVDDDGTTHAVSVKMRGLIREHDMGTWKPGEAAQLKLGLSLRYYKLERDGQVLIESDPVNMVLIVDGKDQLAAQRQALGL